MDYTKPESPQLTRLASAPIFYYFFSGTNGMFWPAQQSTEDICLNSENLKMWLEDINGVW